MGTIARRHYRIALTGRSARRLSEPPFLIRHPRSDDRDRLAELMLDSYIGTIDYEGEGIDEAEAEIDDYLAGSPMLGCSWVAEDAELLLAAVLVSQWDERPLFGYVMTRAAAKGHGVAATLVEKSIDSLRAEGWETVDAFITSGNTPSERLFARAGARLVD
ncbi:MAG TPA: GNAT family N-acetyltransferase [Acidimicrobiia bacterium]